ncbi:hypothetical protein [Microvirga brassicacearum]|nr:hypothetical protein [Microvirga brassicacearum]
MNEATVKDHVKTQVRSILIGGNEAINENLLTAMKATVDLIEYADSDGRGFTGDNRTEWEQLKPGVRLAIKEAEAANGGASATKGGQS